MGRLINADALAEGYKHMGYDPTEHPEESYLEGWCKGFNAAVDHCMYHVIHAPTIEERKTGRWKHGREVCREYVGTAIAAIQYEHWECSECGYRPDGEPIWRYCPNCGAKMEG